MSAGLPAEKAAERIRVFLAEIGCRDADFQMVEDGEDGWAFWLRPEDTTSYVHADGTVEWYGLPPESPHPDRGGGS